MLGFIIKTAGCLFKTIKKWVLTFLLGFIFAILCFAGINAAMVPVSESEYCGSKCHEMNTAYLSWELSTHGSNDKGVRIECIDCHLPPKDKYFTHLAVKAYEGGKDVYKHYFGDEYDLEKIRKKVLEHISNQRCLGCHDNLMARPSNPAARIAHNISLNHPEKPLSGCVMCHEESGHQRQDKLFPP